MDDGTFDSLTRAIGRRGLLTGALAVDAGDQRFLIRLSPKRTPPLVPSAAPCAGAATTGSGAPANATIDHANGQFAFPQGIAVDAAGRVYVADSGNHRIQMFEPK